jgi:hypothetical protein
MPLRMQWLLPLRQLLFPFWVGGFAKSGSPDRAFSVIYSIYQELSANRILYYLYNSAF